MKKIEKAFLRDEENRIIVDMTVNDDSAFLSPFSPEGTPVVNADVAEFIEDITDAVPKNESLTLRIHSDCIDDDEKQIYSVAIKEYYTEKYISLSRELKRNRALAAIFAIIGILVIAFNLILQYKFNAPIWTEVIDIVAWVFLWETVDISAFENRSLRLKMARYRAFVDMKIKYCSKSKQKIFL